MKSLALAFLAFCALPAFAADPSYLPPGQPDLILLLPAPPPAGSALERAELAAVAAAQKAATPERIALAVADANESVFDMFTRTLGTDFVQASLPATAAFFARVGESEDAAVGPAKTHFGRKRPFLTSPEIKALVPASKSGSWPSSHTSHVTLTAIVLAAMLPERRDAIWARAAEYAESRVIGGVHYPLDLDAGRRAGTAIAAVMFTNPGFRADLEAARAETRRVLGM